MIVDDIANPKRDPWFMFTFEAIVDFKIYGKFRMIYNDEFFFPVYTLGGRYYVTASWRGILGTNLLTVSDKAHLDWMLKKIL